MGSSGPAQEWKTFENEAGLTITIRFVDGKPMSVIPAGYTEVGARSEQALEAPSTDRDNDDNDGPPPGSTSEPVDLSMLSADELEKLGDGTADAGIIEKVVGYTIPLAGTAMRIGREMKAADVNREVMSRLSSGKNPDGSKMTPKDRVKLGAVFNKTLDTDDTGSGIFGGQRNMTEGLQDFSGDGKINFADTFLGDLMGFDGGNVGVQAKDKDGNPLGLGSSISGGRRKGSDLQATSDGNLVQKSQGYTTGDESKNATRSTGRDSRDDDAFKSTSSGTAKVKQADGSTKTMKTYNKASVKAKAKEMADKGQYRGGRAKGGLMRKSK